MTAFLAGLGITLVAFFTIFAGVIIFAGIIATIRAAINGRLGSFAKIVWILLSLFVPGAAFFYFAFVERNAFLKFVGWCCLLFFALVAILGGTALWATVEAFSRNPHNFSLTCYSGPEEGNVWKLPECHSEKTLPDNRPSEPESPDDSTLSL